VAEQLDEVTTLELRLYEGVVREARQLCREALLAATASDEEITRTVAARLREYRDPRHHQNKQLVARAEAVERSVTAWMPPLIAAQDLLAAVSVGNIVSQGNLTIQALEEHQRHVVKAIPDMLILSSIHERFAQAETAEEQAEILFTLSDDELQSGARLSKVLDSERKRVEQLVRRATLIQAEIAGTIVAILEYLVARRLLLDEFIDATHYFDEVPPEEKIAFEETVDAAKRVAQVAIEFLVTKAGPKLLQQVPIVGLAVGAADLVNDMRIERRDFRERTVLIRERTEALIGRNATTEIFDLGEDLDGDAEKLIKLRKMVAMLDQFLQQSASENEPR
jgi:hypothetical protein